MFSFFSNVFSKQPPQKTVDKEDVGRNGNLPRQQSGLADSLGEDKLFSVVKWTKPNRIVSPGPSSLPRTSVAAPAYFPARPASSIPTEELLSCNDISVDDRMEGSWGPIRTGPAEEEVENKDNPNPPNPCSAQEWKPGVGVLILSGGHKSRLDTEYNLSPFHGKTVFITSAKHHRRLCSSGSGSVVTMEEEGPPERWLVTLCEDGYMFTSQSSQHVLLCEGGLLKMAPIQNGSRMVKWKAEDAGQGNVFLTVPAYGQLLQCTPEGALQTSYNRRSWETWRLTLSAEHENIGRDLSRRDEPLVAVSTILPLLSSYIRVFASMEPEMKTLSTPRAMTLALGYFLSEKCYWKVVLPGDVLCTNPKSGSKGPTSDYNVLSWQETMLAFWPSPDVYYIVDFDFKAKFDVVRKTDIYASIYDRIPSIFMGSIGSFMRELERFSEAVRQCFEASKMTMPWWRTASSLKHLCRATIDGDPIKTKKFLASLANGTLNNGASNERSPFRTFMEVLASFLSREDGITNSPAGALHINVENCRARTGNPLEENDDPMWLFDKEEPNPEPQETNTTSMLSSLLGNKNIGNSFNADASCPPGYNDGLKMRRLMRHVNAHGNLYDLAGGQF